MYALKIIKALGPIDAKSVSRDSLLRWMAIVPLGLALAARWLLPTLISRVGEKAGFDLLPYYPSFMSYALLLLAPSLCGMVIGFILLDQRDDRTLTALQVTPMSLNSYLVYRLAAPMVLSVAMTLVVFPVAGLMLISFPALIIAAVAAAPTAPIIALALGSFASNKVQGFALTKVSGILMIAPMIAYFVHSGWQLMFGLVPTYWPVKLFWTLEAGRSNGWIYLVAGLAYQGALTGLLVRRFNRVMTR